MCYLLGKDRLKLLWRSNFAKPVEYVNMSVPSNGTQSSHCVYHSSFLAHLQTYIVSDF
jgi:hypothetical protein